MLKAHPLTEPALTKLFVKLFDKKLLFSLTVPTFGLWVTKLWGVGGGRGRLKGGVVGRGQGLWCAGTGRLGKLGVYIVGGAGLTRWCGGGGALIGGKRSYLRGAGGGAQE